jgi:hypothetical protein
VSLLIADRGPWQVFALDRTEVDEPAIERLVTETRGTLAGPNSRSVADGATVENHDATLLCDTEDIAAGQLVVSSAGERWRVLTVQRRTGLGLDCTVAKLARWKRS